MSLSVHEKNYTPSEWSKRYKSAELTARFFKIGEDITKKARATIKCQLNVPYDTTERSKYDIYGTDLPKDAPILVFIHGGYWQESSKDITAFVAPVFVSNGIKVITVGYDLCPDVQLGTIVSQIQKATEQILTYASDTGSRCVWIMGHSAGAHLAASLLYNEKWVECMTELKYFQLLKGLLLVGGIYNLQPLLTTSFNEKTKLTPEEVKEFSFAVIDKKNNQPMKGLKVIVTVGEADSPVFVNESREYAQRLITFVDNVEYILLRNDTDHFDIVENFLDQNYALTRLMLSLLSK